MTLANHPDAVQLGNDSVAQAADYIAYKRQGVERRNQTALLILDTEEGFLRDSREGLLEEVAVHHQRARKRHDTGSGTWNISIVVLLVAAAFLFAVKTMEPFGLGWMGWVYCIALAVALPYALDRFLQDFRHRAIKRMLVSLTLVTSLATALLFGMLRGDVLAHSLGAEAAVVIDDGDVPEPPTSSNTDGMIATLRLVWALAALAFELAAGIALYDFREGRRVFDLGTLRRLQKELLKVEKELLRVIERRYQLLLEPAMMETTFWVNFERGLQEGRRRHII